MAYSASAKFGIIVLLALIIISGIAQYSQIQIFDNDPSFILGTISVASGVFMLLIDFMIYRKVSILRPFLLYLGRIMMFLLIISGIPLLYQPALTFAENFVNDYIFTIFIEYIILLLITLIFFNIKTTYKAKDFR